MRLLNAKEVAEILQVNTQRVYELTRQGILPSLRIGARQIRFEETRLLRWIENGGGLNAIGLENHKSGNGYVNASTKQRVVGKPCLKNADAHHQQMSGGSALLLDELRGFEPIHFILECTLRVT